VISSGESSCLFGLLIPRFYSNSKVGVGFGLGWRTLAGACGPQKPAGTAPFNGIFISI